MLQEKLKEATRPHHDELEQIMFVNQIMDGSLTPAQYKQLLITNYLSHAIFEEKLFEHLSPELQQQLDIKSRHKLEALKQDLAEMHEPLPDVSAAGLNDIPLNDAAILGALYVLEGATLGGNVIVKRLKVNSNLLPLHLNYHYYQAYGPALVDKWKQFVQVLNNSVPENDYEVTIKAASDMFANIKVLSKLTS